MPTRLRIVAVHQGALGHDGLLQPLEEAELLRHGVGSELGGFETAVFVRMSGPAIRQTISRERAQETARPTHVVAVGTAGHQEQLGAAKGAHVVGEDAVHLSVMFRRHGTAAAPVLIADAPVADVERFAGAVDGALLGERAARRIIAILHPVAKFGGFSRAYIARDVRLGADQPAKPHKLVDAEAVVLYIGTPMQVDALRAPGGRTDAVAPVIVVGETAARPAQYGNAEFLEPCDDVSAIPVDIWNG